MYTQRPTTQDTHTAAPGPSASNPSAPPMSGYTPAFEQPAPPASQTKWVLGLAVGATLIAGFGLIRAMTGPSTPSPAAAAAQAMAPVYNEQMQMAREMMQMAKDAQAMQKERMEMMRREMEMNEEMPARVMEPGGEQ